MEFLSDPSIWATLAILVGLELVLGIDNILVISILCDRLPSNLKEKGRLLGLGAAFIARLVALTGVVYLQKLTTPVLFSLSGKDLILVSGGLFLLYKAVTEIHHVVEGINEFDSGDLAVKATVSSVITQIVLLDLVFSIDSVITAVGLTDHLSIIYASVIVSFIAILFFSKPIANFVLTNPALKILALSFLIVIGVTIFLEGIHVEVPKGYIYIPMGFALGVELLRMRYTKNKVKKAKTS